MNRKDAIIGCVWAGWSPEVNKSEYPNILTLGKDGYFLMFMGGVVELYKDDLATKPLFIASYEHLQRRKHEDWIWVIRHGEGFDLTQPQKEVYKIPPPKTNPRVLERIRGLIKKFIEIYGREPNHSELMLFLMGRTNFRNDKRIREVLKEGEGKWWVSRRIVTQGNIGGARRIYFPV